MYHCESPSVRVRCGFNTILIPPMPVTERPSENIPLFLPLPLIEKYLKSSPERKFPFAGLPGTRGRSSLLGGSTYGLCEKQGEICRLCAGWSASLGWQRYPIGLCRAERERVGSWAKLTGA